MSYKPDRYASRKDVDELEEISERLAADLRKSIRQLVRNDGYFFNSFYLL